MNAVASGSFGGLPVRRRTFLHQVSAALFVHAHLPAAEPVGQRGAQREFALGQRRAEARIEDNPRIDRTQAATDSAWPPLFDGSTLGRWKPTEFGGEGEVHVVDGEIVLEMGNDLTGITWTGALPAGDYEIELSARRLAGHDFFCGLTFPIAGSHCSLIVGGWGGAVVGISSLNGLDASENETSTTRAFTTGRSYAIRVRVAGRRIQAWIDEDRVVAVDTTGRKVTVRAEVLDSRPLGIASWRTRAGLKEIRIRDL
jgi:Domain of Unknown Function (DUF1080)